MLNIEKTKTDDGLLVKLAGKLDTSSAPSFEAEIDELVSADKLTIDFTDLEYISSVGLRLLLVVANSFPDKKVKLLNVNDLIMEIFETVGFVSYFDYE